MDTDFMIPKIKREISKFLGSEEGNISKSSVLAFGGILGSAVLTSALLSDIAAAWAESWVNWSQWTNSAPTFNSITYS